MPRRNYQTSVPGQVFAVEWPEWHVECACPGCTETVMVAGLGEALTSAEAEKFARENRAGQCAGWKKIDGLWRCPKHAGRLS